MGKRQQRLDASDDPLQAPYRARRTQNTTVVRVLKDHLDEFIARASDDSSQWRLPAFVADRLQAMTRCGDFLHGFVRLECTSCRAPRVVPFACKSKLCSSCAGRRMNEMAAHLVDRVLPPVPMRQWVFTMPGDLASLVAFDASLCAAVVGIFADEVNAWHHDCARQEGIETPQTGCVLEIQRFADGLRLWVHAHALVPQGVFFETPDHRVLFHRTRAPAPADITGIAQRIERRVRRLLNQRGLLADQPDQQCDPEATPDPCTQMLLQCAMARPAAHRRVSHARPRPSRPKKLRPNRHRLCRRSTSGFELHAGVTVRARDRRGLERLCRYIGRPPIAQDRLTIMPDGRIEYQLKRTWSGGVTSVVFEPLTFIARLVALLPPPGFHLRRFYGVFAPNHPMRARVVPAPPDPRRTKRPVAPRRPKSMAWADLLKRVFLVDVLKCPRCGGLLRIIAAIHHPQAIDAIIAAVIISGDLDPRYLGRPPPPSGTLFKPPATCPR
jgi:hypothetical protein